MTSSYKPTDMSFAKLDTSEARNRCGNCMEPYRVHRPRMAAPPTCPKGGTIYREATEEELQTAYRQEFGDGPPKPIATFKTSDPADMERLAEFMNSLRGTVARPVGAWGDGIDQTCERVDPCDFHIGREEEV